ncbi:MAG: PD40 domain-containing protein [Planctomycetes bacterium]|nr:PD40 domain-containing protein [Planctomycetota bacterium]
MRATKVCLFCLGLGALLRAQTPMFEPGTAMNLGGVTGSDDFSPTLSEDELYMVFASNRPGGAGGYDLYETSRPSVTAPFAPPQPIVALNTAAAEYEMSLVSLPGGQFELYFVRATTASQVFVAQGAPFAWGPAVLVPGGPNQAGWANDDPYVTDDGLTMFFTSNGGGTAGGGADIYTSQRPVASPGAPWSPPQPFAPANSPQFDHSPLPESNGNIVYFSSTRPGGGGGSSDIWVTSLDHNTNQWTAPIAVTELNTADWESNMWRSGLTGRIFVSRFITGGARIFCDCWRATFLFIRRCVVSYVVPKIQWTPLWPRIIWCRRWIWRLGTIVIIEFFDWWPFNNGLVGTLLALGGAPSTPFPSGLPEEGTLGLPPGGLVVHAFSLLTPEGRATSQLAIPPSPSLAGLPLKIQGVLLNGAPAPGMPMLIWSEPGDAVLQ